jgi:hypothetical protein
MAGDKYDRTLRDRVARALANANRGGGRARETVRTSRETVRDLDAMRATLDAEAHARRKGR